MILESAMLNIIQGKENEFEAAFSQAKPIISTSPGFVSLELHKCIEVSHQYLLLVKWQTLSDHTEGFRGSVEYQQWKDLLHHFYEPFPTVMHFDQVRFND